MSQFSGLRKRSGMASAMLGCLLAVAGCAGPKEVTVEPPAEAPRPRLDGRWVLVSPGDHTVDGWLDIKGARAQLRYIDGIEERLELREAGPGAVRLFSDEELPMTMLWSGEDVAYLAMEDARAVMRLHRTVPVEPALVGRWEVCQPGEGLMGSMEVSAERVVLSELDSPERPVAELYGVSPLVAGMPEVVLVLDEEEAVHLTFKPMGPDLWLVWSLDFDGALLSRGGRWPAWAERCAQDGM